VARGGVQLDLRRLLTFGGRAPFSVGALLAAATVLTLAGSISPPLGRWLMLQVPDLDTPSWIVLFEAWRLVTWALFQGPLPPSLLTLIFAGLMLVWLGQQLSYAWSEKRFLWRCLGLTAGTGAITLLLLAPFGWPVGYFGMWPLVNALLVTWGLIFPTQRLAWFGVLQMNGAAVARAVTVATPVWALVFSPPGLGVVGGLVLYVPHMVAIALAWAMVAGGPRRVWWRAREWWLRRRLERQRKKFKVVGGTGPGPGPRASKPPKWMN
jgi:hypothetical protein